MGGWGWGGEEGQRVRNHGGKDLASLGREDDRVTAAGRGRGGVGD